MLFREINCYYLIRVTGTGGKSKLVGAGQLYKIIGVERSEAVFKRVLEGCWCNRTYKMRNSVRIDFVMK